MGIAPDDPRVIEIDNKIDALDDDERDSVLTRVARARMDIVALSAVTGEGMDELTRALDHRPTAGHRRLAITLPH